MQAGTQSQDPTQVINVLEGIANARGWEHVVNNPIWQGCKGKSASQIIPHCEKLLKANGLHSKAMSLIK